MTSTVRNFGQTKAVWQVVLPGGHSSWWCFDTEREARSQAKGLKGAQVSEGIATFEDYGEYGVWHVKRAAYKGGVAA